MNKVFLIGRLTQDPVVTTTSSGDPVCRFSLAVSRYSKDGENNADFINIVVWRVLAQNCAKYLEKGSQVAVTGSIQTRNYEDREGKKRTSFDVVAESVEFLSRANNGNKQGQTAGTSDRNVDTLKEVDEDDLEKMPF